MAIRVYPNLSIGTIPPTPANPFYDSPHLDCSSAKLCEIAEQYGFPISYAQENNGQLIQNIVPIKKTQDKQISTSSSVILAPHTETAFHPYKPDYVLLLCVRGDPSVVTTVAHVLDIIKHLDDETLDVLQQPLFHTSLDLSFMTNGESDKQFVLPILKKHTISSVEKHIQITPIVYWTMVYDKALMKGTTEIARLSLIAFENAVEKATDEIRLKTGDLLVLENNYVVHGRKDYKPRYDGTDRWLRRVMVRKQLPPSGDISGHTITTKFI